MIEELLEAWRTNNRINLFLIDQISDEGMACTLSKRGGRDVVRQFAHLHNVRLWHLENRAKELAAGLYKFETDERPDHESHPRGSILLTLKQCGHKVHQATAYAIWDWDKR
jgi:hypothetical protein